MHRTILAAVAALALAGLALGGCSLVGGNDLGETKIEGTFEQSSVKRMKHADTLAKHLTEAGLSPQQVQTVFASVTRPLPKRLVLRDGKDKQHIDWKLDIAEGTVDYEADKVSATDPAKVKQAIAEAAGDDAVKAIEKAFPGGISGLVQKLSSAGVL